MNKAPGFILTQFGFNKGNALDRIKATDDHTVTIKVAEAQAPTFLFYCLSANVGSVVEKKLALSRAQGEDFGNGWLKTASAGSNSWVVRSWKASDSVVLDAAPGAATKLKRMVIRHIAEPATQLLLLQKGDADIARNLNPEQLHAVKGKPEFALVSKSLGAVTYISMNQGMPELTHPDVAQAMKWAIDYDAIATNITPDTYKTHQAFLPEGFPGAYNENPFHKDLDKAKALMKTVRNGEGVHRGARPPNRFALQRRGSSGPGRSRGNWDQGRSGRLGIPPGDHQIQGAAASDGDVGLGQRLFRPQLQRADLLRQRG